MMDYRAGQVIEVTTRDVAHGGWCVAQPEDGLVVFVRHALPGETVLARLTEVTSRLARADAVEILKASPDRVQAPCPHAHPGGCGGCEADTNVLGTIGWDLSRFGIQFVASPRHADGLLVTGCVSRNMELALKKAWNAVPEPRIVIAVGACAIAGGPFVDHPEILNGATSVVPVDLFIPGCPPHPLTILDGLLRLLGRIDGDAR